MGGNGLLDAFQHGCLVRHFAKADDEGDEIIMVVLLLARPQGLLARAK
jgi:hypothetical protein